MARVPLHTIDDASPASRELLSAILPTSPTGKPLNMQAQMAHAPAVLAGYVSLRRATEAHGTLDPKTRSAVMAATSSTLDVPYVEAVTALLAVRSGWSSDQALGFTEGRGSDDEELDALLDLITEATLQFGRVSDELWDAALDRGWTTENLTEAVAYVAVVLYSAFFVNYADTELDIPTVPAPTSA